MNKHPKTYPSGVINPDYVEELFNQMDQFDQKDLIKKLIKNSDNSTNLETECALFEYFDKIDDGTKIYIIMSLISSYGLEDDIREELKMK